MENSAAVPPPPHPNNSNLARTIANTIGRIALIIVVAFASHFITQFIIVLVFFPTKHPEFQVDSFSLSNYTLIIGNDSSSSAISMAAQVQLTARNPNRYADLSFGRADASVLFRSSWLLGGPTVLPPFSLDFESQAPLTASFDAVVGGSKGNVAICDVRLVSSVMYDERNHSLLVICDGLIVGIPSNNNGTTPAGGLIGGAPIPCGVVINENVGQQHEELLVSMLGYFF